MSFFALSFLFLVASTWSQSCLANEATRTELDLKQSSHEGRSECQVYFDENKCEQVIANAKGTEKSKFLDCNKSPLQKTASCVVSGGASYILARTLPPHLAKNIGSKVWPLVPFYVGYRVLDKVTLAEQRCYENTEYKEALLRPMTAYYGEEHTQHLMRKDCIFLERKARAFVEKVKGDIYNKDLEYQRLERFLSQNADDPRRMQQFKRRFPEKKWALTAQERDFLASLQGLEAEQHELLKATEKIYKEKPCRSYQYYANALCAVAGGGLGASAKKVSARIPATLSSIRSKLADSGKVRFFVKDREVPFTKDSLQPGKSYTILLQQGKLLIGENLPKHPGKFVKSGVHISLNKLGGRNLHRYDFYAAGGALRLNKNGQIDISGFHAQRVTNDLIRNLAAKRVKRLIERIIPDAALKTTPGRLPGRPI